MIDSAFPIQPAFNDKPLSHEFILLDDQCESSLRSCCPTHLTLGTKNTEEGSTCSQTDCSLGHISIEEEIISPPDSHEAQNESSKLAVIQDSTKSKKSSIKPYNIGDIPIHDRRCCWKQLPKPNLHAIRNQMISPRRHCENEQETVVAERLKRAVSFTTVVFREYDQILGDNPGVSYGPPLGLDWTFEEMEALEIDVYERLRGKRRTFRQMMLNSYNRTNILVHYCGYGEDEIKVAVKNVKRIKRSRALTKALLPAQVFEEALQSAMRKTKRFADRRSLRVASRQ